MRLRALRVANYKSFEDSGVIEFSDGFNVIVGKNSSGKTALLEALRLEGTPPKPHRSQDRRPGESLSPSSVFEVAFAFSQNELRDSLMGMDRAINFPVPQAKPGQRDIEGAIASLVHSFFEGADTTLRIRVEGQSRYPSTYPSHELFTYPRSDQKVFVNVAPNPDKRGYNIGRMSGGDQDSVISILPNLTVRKLYVFKAERLNIGEKQFLEERVLTENASNLPNVLLYMSSNPFLFRRFNQHINEIFPYIKGVTAFPKEHNVEVRIWWVDPTTERVDLAIPLQESGTGISQALAILCVAMTVENGIIVIDEPNSFLHPGASKTLMKILSQYDHQYIVTTHSLEVMAVANPKSLFVVRWESGRSVIEEMDWNEFDARRKLLTELGVLPSDMFGVDEVVWVEGETEQECFPLILQHKLRTLPAGLAFVAVRSVDEVAANRKTAELALQIYGRITELAVLLPRALRFSFDREKKTNEEILRIESDHRRMIRFLPARHYECFLLHPRAISNVLSNATHSVDGASISQETVSEWISANAGNYHSAAKWTGDITNGDWRRSVNAAKLLRDMFQSLANIEFSKTTHARQLTAWLLENDPTAIDDLIDYVKSLVDSNRLESQ